MCYATKISGKDSRTLNDPILKIPTKSTVYGQEREHRGASINNGLQNL